MFFRKIVRHYAIGTFVAGYSGSVLGGMQGLFGSEPKRDVKTRTEQLTNGKNCLALSAYFTIQNLTIGALFGGVFGVACGLLPITYPLSKLHEKINQDSYSLLNLYTLAYKQIDRSYRHNHQLPINDEVNTQSCNSLPELDNTLEHDESKNVSCTRQL